MPGHGNYIGWKTWLTGVQGQGEQQTQVVLPRSESCTEGAWISLEQLGDETRKKIPKPSHYFKGLVGPRDCKLVCFVPEPWPKGPGYVQIQWRSHIRINSFRNGPLHPCFFAIVPFAFPLSSLRSVAVAGLL